jgi:hypothetical protein
MEIPLQLWNRPHWELRGQWDSVLFFRHLAEVLPTATTLFIEGTNLTNDVDAALRSMSEPGDYLPKRQTLWPQPKQYRVRFDEATLATLANLAETHAESEVMDHLFVYNSSEALLEFPDAFGGGCSASLSGEIDEQRIRSFAVTLGLDVMASS